MSVHEGVHMGIFNACYISLDHSSNAMMQASKMSYKCYMKMQNHQRHPGSHKFNSPAQHKVNMFHTPKSTTKVEISHAIFGFWVTAKCKT